MCAVLTGQSHTCKVLFRLRPLALTVVSPSLAAQAATVGVPVLLPSTHLASKKRLTCQNPHSNGGDSSIVQTSVCAHACACVLMCVRVRMQPSPSRSLLMTIMTVLSFLCFLCCSDVGSSEGGSHHAAIAAVLLPLS